MNEGELSTIGGGCLAIVHDTGNGVSAGEVSTIGERYFASGPTGLPSTIWSRYSDIPYPVRPSQV